MGGGAADERQRRVVPRLEPTPDHQEMASLPIPDELLEEILLRLPTPADLARASGGCVTFRRVATNRFFLRRYRKLHTPPLLGLLEQRKVFHPATPPYPSASAANALDLAADFSFSFLPAPARNWVLQDIRDGRVLLKRSMRVPNSTIVFPEVVVCDPLHRRYRLLPQITDDQAASVEDPFLLSRKRPCLQIFLVPTGDGEEAATADETSFRVVWMAQCKTRLVAFVFSSNTGQWHSVPPRRWIDLSADMTHMASRRKIFCSHYYVYGCVYFWTYEEETKLLVFDIKTMEFSIGELPPEADNCLSLVMVEAGEGRTGMLMLAEIGHAISYFIRQNGGGISNQWQKVKTISLHSADYLIPNVEKYPILFKEENLLLEEKCFTLDIETFQLEKVCTCTSGYSIGLRAYSNFPPSLLSSPTISSGIEEGPEKEMLEQVCAASSSAESRRSE